MPEAGAITFRIYPQPGGRLFANVHVHPTVPDLQRATGKAGIAGLCSPSDVIDFAHGLQRTQPKFADVHLARERLGAGVSSHEMFHLTLAYLRRRRWSLTMSDDCDDYEERVAYINGDLNRQLTIQCLKRKLYT